LENPAKFIHELFKIKNPLKFIVVQNAAKYLIFKSSSSSSGIMRKKKLHNKVENVDRTKI
jgi:hypothetical protein